MNHGPTPLTTMSELPAGVTACQITNINSDVKIMPHIEKAHLQ